MTTINSYDHADKGKHDDRKPGWLSCSAILALSCLFVQCSSDSNSTNSSDGSGGASAGSSNAAGTAGGASTTGATSSSGTSSVETKTTGGASGLHTGGAPASTSSGGAAPAGGTSSKTSGAGGAAPSAGATASGGKATGGATGTAGKSSTGGTANPGGATGTAGRSSTGGAASPGGTTGNAGKSSIGGAAGASSTSNFTLTSPGWTNMSGCGPTAKTSCAPLPSEITRSGAGTSPELHWTGAPAGTKSFVIMLQDLNNGTAHWILWNIAPTVTSLAANVEQTTATPATPAGSQQCGKGTDAATSDGYYGPGAPCNVYEFVVYALSISPFSPTTPTDQESVRTQLQALGSSILGTASLRGRTNTGC